MVQAELRRSGLEDLIAAGIVLTGGAARIEGLTELAYTAAYLIPIAQHRKQELLDQDRLSDLVDSLLDTLRQQLAMLEFMSKAAGTGASDSTYNPN